MLLCRLWQTPQGRESLSPFPSEPFPISWLQQVLAARCRESVCDVWAAVHFFLCGPTTLLGAAYNTKRESRKVEKRRKAAASPKMVPVRALRQAAAPALLIPVVGKIIWRAIEHSRPRPVHTGGEPPEPQLHVELERVERREYREAEHGNRSEDPPGDEPKLVGLSFRNFSDALLRHL